MNYQGPIDPDLLTTPHAPYQNRSWHNQTDELDTNLVVTQGPSESHLVAWYLPTNDRLTANWPN